VIEEVIEETEEEEEIETIEEIEVIDMVAEIEADLEIEVTDTGEDGKDLDLILGRMTEEDTETIEETETVMIEEEEEIEMTEEEIDTTEEIETLKEIEETEEEMTQEMPVRELIEIDLIPEAKREITLMKDKRSLEEIKASLDPETVITEELMRKDLRDQLTDNGINLKDHSTISLFKKRSKRDLLRMALLESKIKILISDIKSLKIIYFNLLL